MTIDHSWLPRASCDASCVRAGGAASGAPGLRAAHRAARPLAPCWCLPAAAGGAAARPLACAARLLPADAALPGRANHGVGGPIRNLRGVLVVSGHVSWVDIFAIGAVLPGSFVAKAELI